VTKLTRAIALATTTILTAGILTVASFSAPVEYQDSADAASVADSFDPGSIITDAEMFNFSTMTTASIQSFLNSKVATCDPTSTAPCLKDYRADVTAVAGIENRCDNSISAASDQTAAQIIHTVAVACEVNPQVLLVTLQKEQGFITRTNASALTYRKAMGYGCPDTASCDSKFYGFFNQVYWAARAMNSYVNFPENFNYSIGVEEIKYNPKSSCGTKTVNIKNGATAALYNYTPYVPNGAALANPGGIGDSCSSYGNRNFWVYFNAWFGSSADTDPYFVKNSKTKQIYLIIDGKRRPIESKREMRLIARYTGIAYKLPSLADNIVSQTGRGSVQVLIPGSVVKSSKSSKSLWFIDGLGTKRPISAGQAKELTGSSTAKVVSKTIIAGYKTGKGSAKLGLKVNGKYFIADNGIIRQIRAADVEHYKKRFGFGTYDVSTLKALDRGVSMGRLLKADGKYYLVRDGRKFHVSTAKYKKLVKQLGKKAQVVDSYFAARIPTKK